MPKIFESFPGSIPMPVSLTFTVNSPPVCVATNEMRPPGRLYFAALLRRFEKTWANRTGSTSSKTGSEGNAICKSFFAAASTGRLVSTALRTTDSKSTRSFRNSSLLRLIRATSRRSSTSRTICSTCRCMIVVALSSDCWIVVRQLNQFESVANWRQRIP